MHLGVVCADIIEKTYATAQVTPKKQPPIIWTDRMAFLLSGHYPKLAGSGGVDDCGWIFAKDVFMRPSYKKVIR